MKNRKEKKKGVGGVPSHFKRFWFYLCCELCHSVFGRRDKSDTCGSSRRLFGPVQISALVAEEMINSYNNLLLSSHEITSILEKTVYKQIQKSKFAIPSCSRYLARVIYKLRLNSWNTKYSQNVTCVCKNILSVKHILLELPQSYFRKMDIT